VPQLSKRAAALKPSPTLSVTSKAKAMKAEGIDVISFAAGEPDFNTPEEVCEAAVKALHQGFTKYTPSSGIPELKEAVVHKLKEENGLDYKPGNIVVSCGAKHSVYNSVMTLLDEGDEAILIAPYWMTYAEQIQLAGGVPVVVHTSASDDFVPDVDAIAEKITKRTKLILINSPCNPTGAVYPRKTLAAIAELAVKNGIWIISDEIYERLVYGAEHVSIASFGPEPAERTITIGGVSKTYSMTGWRIGFAAAPQNVASAMSNFQDQVTSNPTSFAQKGAVAALHLDARDIESMRREFEGRRNLIVERLSAIDGLMLGTPQGAFYAFVDFSAYLGGAVADDLAMSGYLLDEAKVATVPGSVFEGPGYLRLSYAAGRDDIMKGVERIAEALAKLK
jgi:aspartate aminotransferase